MTDYPPLPAFVRSCTEADVANQRIKWSSSKKPWPEAFRHHADLRGKLEDEIGKYGGIRREFVFSHADGDPVRLFLVAMAWGFGGTTVRWPRQRRMLTTDSLRPQLAEIIRQTQASGASAGWSTFRVDQRIAGNHRTDRHAAPARSPRTRSAPALRSQRPGATAPVNRPGFGGDSPLFRPPCPGRLYPRPWLRPGADSARPGPGITATSAPAAHTLAAVLSVVRRSSDEMIG